MSDNINNAPQQKTSEIAEKHIIGAILHDFEKIEECKSLTPEMFQHPIRRDVFTYLFQIYDTGKAFSTSMIEAKYSNNPDDWNVIIDCMESAIEVVLLKPDVSVLVNIYRANMLWKYTRHDLTIDPTKSTEQIGLVINQLESLLENEVIECESVADMVKHYQNDYFKEHETIDLGFKRMDSYICGLDRGDMTVIGARPAVGKSALSLQIAKNLVAAGYKVGIYNLEMKGKQIYERLIAAESGIDMRRIRRATNKLNDEENRWSEANKRLESLHRLIITSGPKSVSKIRQEIRHMDYDILIIDYMQLLQCENRYRGNRENEVAEISRSLKELAMDMNIHIIALSQLNRQAKAGVEPSMAELRESGAIEQDASCIIMMWLLADEKHRGWRVDKCRNGTLGDGAFKFDGSHMTFIEDDGFKPVKPKESTPFDD